MDLTLAHGPYRSLDKAQEAAYLLVDPPLTQWAVVELFGPGFDRPAADGSGETWGELWVMPDGMEAEFAEANDDVLFEDLPEGKWFIEARTGDTVARLFFKHELLLANGHNLGSPRLVVLTPRPLWKGIELPDQSEALLIDGRATHVDEVPYEVADPIVTTLVTGGIYAARDALTAFITQPDPTEGT